jgi:hypothetical protein
MRDRHRNERRIAQRREWNPPDSVGVLACCGPRRLQRKSGLAATARSGQRHDPHVLARKQVPEILELAQAPEERSCGHRKVRAVQSLQGRKIAVAELVDPLRRRQILQPVLAEIAQSIAADEVTRRLRHQHLATVPRRRDPRRPMHVDPHIPLPGHGRLAGVHADSHANRAGQSRLHLPRRPKRVRRASERDEERITLRIYLDACVARKRIAHDSTVLCEHVRIGVTELVEQPRRSLYVAEEERNRPSRQLTRHKAMMRRSPVSV